MLDASFLNAADVKQSEMRGLIETLYTTRSEYVHGEYMGEKLIKVMRQFDEMNSLIGLVFEGLERAIKMGTLGPNMTHSEFLEQLA